jgi:CubicO group peptidase (beta-lactamase class C family)
VNRALAVLVALACACANVEAQSAADPSPKTVEEFKAAVQRVLNETGVPGAGIALVRTSGIEWAGGLGLADRENNIPVTADTHFRAGSISKTFVAAAVVQAYLDDILEIDAPVAQYAPEVAIDNAWDLTDPVRVIHL